MDERDAVVVDRKLDAGAVAGFRERTHDRADRLDPGIGVGLLRLRRECLCLPGELRAYAFEMIYPPLTAGGENIRTSRLRLIGQFNKAGMLDSLRSSLLNQLRVDLKEMTTL